MTRESLLAQFGENLRQLRKTRSLSQEEFASLCGLDRTYLSGLERGRRNPTLLVIVRIAGVLRVDPRQLLVDLQWRESEKGL